MTFVNYGSCSGCDTLQSIQYGYYEDINEKRPYNNCIYHPMF